LLSLGAVPAALSADESLSDDIRLEAVAQLGGRARLGHWLAVRVHLENDGPAVEGELRLAEAARDASTFSTTVELPTGARQELVLYAPVPGFRNRLSVTLVEDLTIVARGEVPFTRDQGRFEVFVVAERPDRLAGDVQDWLAARGGAAQTIAAIGVEDLPGRVEAWGAADRLVWQDVPADALDPEQTMALRGWVALGGHLLILGGSTGAATLAAFPDDLLPYRPEQVVDVAPADLSLLLGEVPTGATSVPAVSGPLVQGTILATTGDGDVIAARMSVGQGSVTVVGFDPATSWLSGAPAARELWTLILPAGRTRDAPEITAARDPWFMRSALANLPSVAVPQLDQLVFLFAGYVLLVGPANYLVLRRLDRREWAWLTVPALVGAFTFGAFGLGITLRGTSVVINELAVVRGAAGSDHGLADAFVGVFSPNRASMDLRLGSGALVSSAIIDSPEFGDSGEPPLDVLLGDPTVVRGLRVGYGDVRVVRAEAAVPVPRLDSDLELVDDRISGRVTNQSELQLERVSVVYGHGIQVLGDLSSGAAAAVNLQPPDRLMTHSQIERELIGGPATDRQSARILAARRALVRSLLGWDGWGGEVVRPGNELTGRDPAILAWRPGGLLDIDVGSPADRVGETLFVLPIRFGVNGQVSFAGGAVARTVVAADAVDWSDGVGGFSVFRGTLTVDYHPVGFDGTLEPGGLAIRLGHQSGPVGTEGELIEPLPVAQQPDQLDPFGSGRGPAALPRVQLFDRSSSRWVEFQQPVANSTYRVKDPGRYLDGAGSLLVRFVPGSDGSTDFWFDVRIEGTAR
jgi:hypothetical protein